MSRLVAVAPNPSIDRFFGLDRLLIGAVNRPLTECRVAGGKGLNVARAAAKLGADVLAVGILAGHAGRWIDEEIERAGVARDWVWVGGETRSCVAIADDRSGALTELNEAGPEIAEGDWDRLLETVDSRLAAGRAELVAISGSLPPGAPADGVARLVERAHARGARAMVDVGGQPLAIALEARPWLVKVNRLEAVEALAGDQPRDEPVAIAAALADRTGGTVVITLGAEGAVAVTPGAPPLRIGRVGVPGPYPVGSGDAFLAGLAAATLEGRSWAESLRRAAGAAAANALMPGAGRLDPDAARQLAESVTLEPVLAP